MTSQTGDVSIHQKKTIDFEYTVNVFTGIKTRSCNALRPSLICLYTSEHDVKQASTSGLDLKTENHEVKCKHLAGGIQAYNTVCNLHLTNSGLP